jgi:tetratricopeptide (TPR) repeat protein
MPRQPTERRRNGGGDRSAGVSLRGWRRWGFPLLAFLLPFALLAALEAALRVAGVGRPSTFFIRDGDRYVSNPRFGWRFFPVALARTPLALSFPVRKPPATFRVFVFGESAAMGIPEPAFGFSRALEALLEESHPGIDVEMINTAMTAINSHVIREIARECDRYEPDVFVVYMGNNEVVGPFGPGTVFTRGAPPLPLVRARMIAQRSRIGQLAERAVGRIVQRPAQAARWRGMEMMTERHIAADDPRLERTYLSFERNLDAILDAADSAGVPAVVSTVATNLQDSPPFASLHGRDENDADLHYELGVSATEAGRTADASRSLSRARDLDLLRFRADARINEAIRAAAGRRAKGAVVLVEAERVFAEASGGAPGDDLFWEHVHLNEAGNELLARAFHQAIAPLMPKPADRAAPADGTLLRAELAERLALTDWDRHRMAAAILDLMRRPPFTRQAGHDARLERRRRDVAVAGEAARKGLDAAEAIYRAAIARRPGDAALRVNFAALLRERGKFAEAVNEWRAVVQGMPHVAEWRSRLAFALADESAAAQPADRLKLEEAERLLREVAAEDPELPAAHVNLGTVLERLGRSDEALAAYREALRLDPGHDVARLNLAALHVARGAPGEAERAYRDAIDADPQAAEPHARLASLLERRTDLDGAVAEYRRAVALDPDLAWARNNLGYLLERRGDLDGALEQYRAAAASDPDYTVARLNLANLLLNRGRLAEATSAFEEVLALARARQDAKLVAGMEDQLRRLRR